MERGKRRRKNINTLLYLHQRINERKHASIKELDESVKMPALFHPMVQPNWKCDDDNP